MAKVSISIPNFLGGVSQQPTQLRLVNQSSAMTNYMATAENGLIDRPAAEWLGALTAAGTDLQNNPAQEIPGWHFIDRSTTERYLLVANPDAGETPFRVYDLNSVTGGAVDELDVIISEAAYEYIQGASDARQFRYQTVGDITFILNPAVTAIMDEDYLNDVRNPGAIIYVRGTLGGQNEKVYITIDGVSTAEVNCSAGESDTQNLTGQIFAELGGTNGVYGTVNSVRAEEISATGHGFSVGQPVNFSASSGTDYMVYRYWVEGRDPEPLGNQIFTGGYWATAKAHEGKIFFVSEVIDANTFTVSDQPGGEPLVWDDDGTNATVRELGSGSSAFPGFNFVRRGSIIYITRTDGADFDIEVQDGGGDSLVSVYKDTAQTFAELPTMAPHGFHLKIEGDETTLRDNYYVKFNAVDGRGAVGVGVWSEAAGSGVEKRFLNGRMPLIAIRQADGSFLIKEANGRLGGSCGFNAVNNYVTVNHGRGAPVFEDSDEVYFTELGGASGTPTTFFTNGQTYYAKVITDNASSQVLELYTDPGLDPGDLVNFDSYWSIGYLWKDSYQSFQWGERLVGDDLSNPDPSFIGGVIRDVKLFNNRLALVGENSVVLSESGEFFNFFRTTVQSVLDSAPIDLSSAASKPSQLRNAKTMGGGLVVLADRAQFAIPIPRDGLTPSTASLDLVAEMAADNVIPASLGRSLFFPHTYGSQTRVKEFLYIPENQGQNYVAYDITEQCPRYIAGSPVMMASSSNEMAVALVSDTDLKSIFVYRSYTRGDERIQSAWMKFTLATGEVVGMEFIDDRLYLVTRRTAAAGGFAADYDVEFIDFAQGLTDGNLTYPILMDRKTTVTPGVSDYDSLTGLTTVSLPYNINGTEGANFQVVTEDGAQLAVDSYSAALDELYVSGDYEGVVLYVGEKYTPQCQLSEPVPRDQQGSAIGRDFRINHLDLHYDDTVHFEVLVTLDGGSEYIYPVGWFDPLTPGVPNPMKNGVLTVPIMSHSERVSITIQNPSPFPSRLASGRFHGSVRVPRESRI